MFLHFFDAASRSIAAFTILILAFFVSVGAQPAPGTFSVAVKDQNGAAVSGATAELNLGGVVIKSGVSDSEGIVRFEGVKSGEYKVKISANGFTNSLTDASVGEGAVNSINVVLGIGGVNETVSVTATRTQVVAADTAVPVSVLDRDEIERKNVNTIGDLFRTLPGTSTTNEGAFQVRPRIRGLESNRVLILIDGERLNNSRTSTGQSGIELGLVEPSQVQTVEVVRGSGSVLYGTDALAGTINIITRDTPPRRESGFRFGATLDTFFTSNETGRRGTLGVTGSGKHFAFRLSQSLDRFGNYFTGEPSATDAERLRLNSFEITDEGEALNSQSHSGNSQATLRFFLNDTSTIKAGYERRRGADIGSAGLAGVFSAFFPFNNRDKFNVRYDVAAITKNLQRVSVKAFYQTQHRNFTNVLTVGPAPPFFPGLYQSSETVTDTKTTGFDAQSDWVFGRHNIVAGASYFNDDNTDRRLVIQSTTPTSTNRTFRNTRSVPDASLSNIAFFAQDDYRLTNRLRLTGGVRFDRFKTAAEPTTGFALDPRLTPSQIELLGLTGLSDGLDVTNNSFTGDLGAVYTLTENVNLSARVGRSFRTPNISERFFTDSGSAEGFLVGNPSLVPESGINFDTSVKLRTKRLTASATYFNNYFKNFLATAAAFDDSVPPRPIQIMGARGPIQVFQTRNIRTARIQGFEAEFEAPIRISHGYLTPYGNFSYLRGDDLNRNVPLDFISPVRSNIGFRWQNFGKSYYFDYNARIVKKQNRLSDSFRAINGGAEAGYVSHNIGGGYYFRRERFNFSVNAGVSNIFDRYYSEQFTFAPARGRSFTIGTTWDIR